MKKYLITVVCLILAISLLSGCNNQKSSAENMLVNAYMAVIDDILYIEDPGLNHDIKIIALDTTQMNNLLEEEKAALLAQISEKYGLTVLDSTYDELMAQGLIDEENLYFTEGILVTIEHPVYDEATQCLSYGISKWRSGLGAYGSDDATAQYKNGIWQIEKKNSWIS
jgi:hypothetical protein